MILRLATLEDVPAIRAMLADDKLGRQREDLSEEGLLKYQRAMERIQSDPGNDLYVAEQAGRLVGTYQITWIPYLSRAGSERALIEAVRVASDLRGQGIGRQMMEHALSLARERGCLLAQLTTDVQRPEARRFYERLGFESTHHGMKINLRQESS